MVIFSNDAYVSIGTAKKHSLQLLRNDPAHLLPPDSVNLAAGRRVNAPRGKPEAVTPASFEEMMLKAMDTVSGAQLRASDLQKEAIINPGSIDIHDVTIAQAEASMALGVTRNILSRLVQGWRDLINTR